MHGCFDLYLYTSPIPQHLSLHLYSNTCLDTCISPASLHLDDDGDDCRGPDGDVMRMTR